MNAFQPHVVFSYGSYLEALFVYIQRTGAQFHRPGVVAYGSDSLAEGMRRLITERFGIHVFSLYSAIETGEMGFECEAHVGLHMNIDLWPVRIVDPAERELPHGESGQVLVSNLVNRATVLLNYRLGDLVSMLPRQCPCGRSLPLLSSPEGRLHEWVESPSGERVHPQTIRSLFTQDEDVWRYQVIQRPSGEFAVAVVPADGADRQRLRARLERKFLDRFGPGVVAEIHFVTALPRTEHGKVRTVVVSERTSPA